MRTFNLRHAKARFPALVDQAARGETIAIARRGKPVACLIPIEAVEIAPNPPERQRPSFASFLQTFPGGEFERNPKPSPT
jgi:prevent-host-death family protein